MSLLIQETVSRIVEVAHGPGAKDLRIKRARTLAASFRDLARERERGGAMDMQLRDRVSSEVERLREAIERRRQVLVRQNDDRADEVLDALSHRLFD